MLSARELKVFYGVIQGLKGVDIDIHDREIVGWRWCQKDGASLPT